MKLNSFSVTNYRSITKAHKIDLQDLTVLVGKNNEGKSNFLNALQVAMSILLRFGRMESLDLPSQYINSRIISRIDGVYSWKRDFPVHLQNRKNNKDSIFRMEFKLEPDELIEFHNATKTHGNEFIQIVVKIGDKNEPKVEVPKKGTSSYNNKATQVARFISQRISFNYIRAIRTEEMAFNELQNVIDGEIDSLMENKRYAEAVSTINEIQQETLDSISSKLLSPLQQFLPQINKVTIKKRNYNYIKTVSHEEFEVVIDDGTPTSISYKGDGIKSLITLAILKNRRIRTPASIIAIEEPESHLHPGALHELADVIHEMSHNNQVIITTHNPLFIQQNRIKSNIIVDNGTVHPANSIAEIRDTLGVMLSDNLRDARFYLIVEGENDKVALSKILPAISPIVEAALRKNELIIKAVGGAGNLTHELFVLKNDLCKYIVLMDNDVEGIKAIENAITKGYLKESEYKLTSCPGSKESEFEDCLQKSVYESLILNKYGFRINVPEFRNNHKWSERIRDARIKQGGRWTDSIKTDIKCDVALAIPDTIEDIDSVLIREKSKYLYSLVDLLEKMITEEDY